MDDPTTANDPDITRQVRHPLPGAPPAPGLAPVAPPTDTVGRRRLASAIAAGMVLAAVAGAAGTAAILVDGPSSSASGTAVASGVGPGDAKAAKTSLGDRDGATISANSSEDRATMAATGTADPVALDEAPAADPPEVTPADSRPAPTGRPGPAPGRPPRPRA